MGSIFIGAVHDFTSLIASLRHKGQFIGKIIEGNIGQYGKQLFLIFPWSTLVLIIAAFTILVAKTLLFVVATILVREAYQKLNQSKTNVESKS